jgi:hypothetical protein
MSFLYKADPVRGAVWAELFARIEPGIVKGMVRSGRRRF